MKIRSLWTVLLVVVSLWACYQEKENPQVSSSTPVPEVQSPSVSKPEVQSPPVSKPEVKSPPVSASKTLPPSVSAPEVQTPPVSTPGTLFSSLHVPEPSFHFEPVVSGQYVNHDYIVQNKGTAELKITSVKTG